MTIFSAADIARRLEPAARDLLRAVCRTGALDVPRLFGTPLRLMQLRLITSATDADVRKHRGFRIYITPLGKQVGAAIEEGSQ